MGEIRGWEATVAVSEAIHSLASPGSHGPVFASLNKISVLETHTLDSCRIRTLVVHSDTRATVPVVPVGLVIDLDHVLAGGCHDALRVELHASDWLFVGIRVGDRASAQIPDLLSVRRMISSG